MVSKWLQTFRCQFLIFWTLKALMFAPSSSFIYFGFWIWIWDLRFFQFCRTGSGSALIWLSFKKANIKIQLFVALKSDQNSNPDLHGSFGSLDPIWIRIEIKSRIRIHIETMPDPQHWFFFSTIDILFGHPALWLTIIVTVSPKRRKINEKRLSFMIRHWS